MLSVCLITKMKVALLPRALKSVQGVADEIIVADTGSKDLHARGGEKLWSGHLRVSVV